MLQCFLYLKFMKTLTSEFLTDIWRKFKKENVIGRDQHKKRIF